jgi:hypothetical protein
MKIAIPNGSILPAYQRQVYERLSYPAGVDPADYAEIPLPEDVAVADWPSAYPRLRSLRGHGVTRNR